MQFHGDNSPEFSYRPMSMTAVLSFVLGLLSLCLMLIWFLLPLAVVSGILAILSIFKLRQARGEYGGLNLAVMGLLFSVLAISGGFGYQVYAYQTEMPPGYHRISFTRDISVKGQMTMEGRQGPHPDIIKLVGQKIFVKGFMYPTGQMTDLKSFLLVKDSDQCCFGGKPKLWDMMGVYMEGANLANFYSGRVSVAGTFRINTEYRGESELEPVFILDGIVVQPSHSDFDPVAPPVFDKPAVVKPTESQARTEDSKSNQPEADKSAAQSDEKSSTEIITFEKETPGADKKVEPAAEKPTDKPVEEKGADASRPEAAPVAGTAPGADQPSSNETQPASAESAASPESSGQTSSEQPATAPASTEN